MFTDDDYGDIGDANSAGYYDVTFTFVCVAELSNAQAVCRFTMAENGVLLSKFYRLGVSDESTEPTADEAELALQNYLMMVYQSAKST